jgi:phosphohistidine phosphatase
MKKLILIRHSKAEKQKFDVSDFERSLTTKGKNIANIMAFRLKESETSIGVVISSPAFRAIETALIFSGIYKIPSNSIMLDDSIYDFYGFNMKALCKILSKINDEEDTVTLFGHNTSFTELAFALSAGQCDFMPKCGIVTITFGVNLWKEIKENTGNVIYQLNP